MEHQLRAELGASRITASRAESAKTHKKVLQSEKKGSLRRACAGGSTGLNCLAGASHRLAALPEVRARCTRRGDILRTGVLKNFLRALSPVRIVGVHGKENTALLHASLVAFRSLLRTPMPTRAPAIPPTAPHDSYSRQGQDDGTSSNERPESRNAERSNSREPAQSTA